MHPAQESLTAVVSMLCLRTYRDRLIDPWFVSGVPFTYVLSSVFWIVSGFRGGGPGQQYSAFGVETKEY